MTIPTPSAIEAFAQQLQADTGEQPVVEYLHDRRWKVTVQNSRVRMWVSYDVLSRGRLKWAQSQLYVNGERVARATSYEDFLDIFRGGQDVKPDMQEAVVQDAPAPIRRAYGALVQRNTGLEIKVLRGNRRWSLVAEGPGVLLKINATVGLMNPSRPEHEPVCKMSSERPIEVFLDGVDLTDEIDGRLDRALGRIVMHQQSATASAGVSGPSDARVTATGVTVRNTVVRRN